MTVAITGANSAFGRAILRRAACDAALGLRLTSLDEMIRHSLEADAPA